MNVKYRVDNARCLSRRLSSNVRIVNLGPRRRVLQIGPQCQDLVTSGGVGIPTPMGSAPRGTRCLNIGRKSTAEGMTAYSVATHGVRFSFHSASQGCKIHYPVKRLSSARQRHQHSNKNAGTFIPRQAGGSVDFYSAQESTARFNPGMTFLVKKRIR